MSKYELKTKLNDSSVTEFIGSVKDPVRQADCFELLEIMEKITGEPAKMWGKSIVGFGSYHYKYASGQEGDWMATGFSPRVQSLTIYIMDGFEKYKDHLGRLGKHKSSVSCLYIDKLSDIDLAVLTKIIEKSYKSMSTLK